MIPGFQTYLTDQDLSENTLRSYLRAVSVFSRWFSGTNGYDLRLETITAQDIKEFREFLKIRGRKPATINTYLAGIRSLCNFWGVDSGQVRSVREQTTAPKWLDKPDQNKLIKAAQLLMNGAPTIGATHKATRDYIIFIVLLNTGMRVSELSNLTLDDINISERKGSANIRDSKGNKSRVVPLNNQARSLLSQWLDLRPGDLENLFGVKPRTIQRYLEKISRMAGIECTPHTLRHTLAHNLINSGISQNDVATLLGHDSLNTTRLYTQPGYVDLENAVKVLE